MSMLACAAFALAALLVPPASTAQQTLYVDDNGAIIHKIAPDGTQTTFATGLGGVAGPIALDAAGNVYVGLPSFSGYGGGIVRYAPDGTRSDFVNYPTISNVTGLAFDGSGHLFEAEYTTDSNDNSTMHKITQGVVVSAFPQAEDHQRNLAFDAAGNLYVADTAVDSVVKIAPDGTQSTFATGLDEPDGLAVDANDNVYVANNANGFGLTLSKITPAGVSTTYATGLAAPAGLTFDAYGNLYVANGATHGGGTITEITPAGAKSTFTTGFTNPNGIAFGPLPVPVVSSDTRASVQAGTAFSYQIVTSNTPTSYNATGLPDGLTIDTADGLISYTTNQVGIFTVSLSVANAAGTGSGILTLTITSSTPTPTPTPSPTPVVPVVTVVVRR